MVNQQPKILVIFYSFEGNTKLIAQAIAEEINADILELKVKKDIKTKGFMKYFWAGRQVVHRIKPELFPFDKVPNDYDVIFIGTPVWAFTFAPAIRTFFSQVKLKGKKICLFCCHGGIPAKTFEHMKKELADNAIIGQKDFLAPLNNLDKNLLEAKNWAKEMMLGLSKIP